MLKKKSKSIQFTVLLFLVVFLLSFPAFAENWACEGFTAGTFNGSPACVKDGSLHLCFRNFPDYYFRKFIIRLYDPDQDLLMTQAEAEQILEIKCDHAHIAQMDGIAFFTNLESLDCGNNLLKTLNVSKNSRLKTLICRENDLASLTIDNSGLTYLDCSDNILTALDTVSAENLLTLMCDINQLTVFDLSAPKLVSLSVTYNSLNKFYLDNYPALQELNCSNNSIRNISIESVSNLKILHCSNNKKISRLNAQNLPYIEQLICDNNRITELNVSGLSHLEQLNCSQNKLTLLNLSGAAKLEYLNCDSNQISTLDLSSAAKLKYLHCDSNQIVSLDLRCTPLLEELSCKSNRIPSLDLTVCANLISADIRLQEAMTAHITPLPDQKISIVDIGALVGHENLSHVADVRVFTYPTREFTFDTASGIATIYGYVTKIAYTYNLSCPSVHTEPQIEIIVNLECTHNWAEATCTSPSVCTACRAETGECIPHTFAPASQTAPPTCTVCGEESGHPLEHIWLNATCTARQKCKYCAETIGGPLGHDFSVRKDCSGKIYCSRCSEHKNVQVAHEWVEDASKASKCKFCGLRDSSASTPHVHRWITISGHGRKCSSCGRFEQTDPVTHNIVGPTFFTRQYCTECKYIGESAYINQYLLPILAVLFVIEYTAAVWYLLDYRRIRKY